MINTFISPLIALLTDYQIHDLANVSPGRHQAAEARSIK
jgi:hypothetical protein